MVPKILLRFSALPIGLAFCAGCSDDNNDKFTVRYRTLVQIENVQFTSHPVRTCSAQGLVLPHRRYNVVAPFDGVIVFSRNRGERIAQGEILMQFSSDQLMAEKQQLEQMLAGQPDNWRWRERLQVVENQIAASVIRAPFDLLIATNVGVVGNPYKQNSLLIEAVESGPLRIAAQFPRWLADRCKTNSRIDLTIDQMPVGCDVQIDTTQKQSLSSLLVYIKMVTDSPAIQPDQSLDIYAESIEHDQGYWFPLEAIQWDAEISHYINVVESNEDSSPSLEMRIRKLPIRLAARQNNQVFGACDNFGELQIVPSGNHRIVSNQLVKRVPNP